MSGQKVLNLVINEKNCAVPFQFLPMTYRLQPDTDNKE